MGFTADLSSFRRCIFFGRYYNTQLSKVHDCQSCNNFWCISFYLQQKYKLETKLTFLLYLSFDTGESIGCVDRVLVHCLITGQKSVATQGLKYLSNVANEIFLVLFMKRYIWWKCNLFAASKGHCSSYQF